MHLFDTYTRNVWGQDLLLMLWEDKPFSERNSYAIVNYWRPSENIFPQMSAYNLTNLS